MIVNDIVTGTIGIITGYLLGSIPSAYITTRLARGEDIRKLGGGNVGGLNVYLEVGTLPAAAVAVIDIGKGAAAVAIALWLLQATTPFVLLAGLAAVIGHNWMIWLKFRGGKGAGAIVGALSVLFPAYGYLTGLLIFFGAIALPLIITRNVALSIGIALAALPFITWLGMHSGIGTVMAVVVGLVTLVRFLPTARRAWLRSESKKDFIFARVQRHRH